MKTCYRAILRSELGKRKSVNERYSLRAFAKDIGLSPSRLSMVLNEKEGISVETGRKIARKINLSEKEKELFLNSVGALHSRKNKERAEFEKRLETIKSAAVQYNEIHMEYFRVISDWHHFAILELTRLKEFKNDPQWIAGVLGLEVETVEEAIERMKNLELLREENGALIDEFQFLATPGDTPSDSLKKFNTQLIKKAAQAVYTQGVDEREIASNIFAINKEELPLLKEQLRKLRRSIESYSESKDKNAVYCLSTQFFELTKEIK